MFVTNSVRRFLASALLPLCLVLVVGAAVPAWAADSYPLRDAVECHPRSGLPNFRAKVDAGRTVKVAYFGGSITAAPGWRRG